MDQPQAYTVCETAVLSMAFFSHVLGAGRAMIALVAVSMVLIGAKFYVSSFDTLTRSQINAWELATNTCFVIENLLVIVHALALLFGAVILHFMVVRPVRRRRNGD